MNYAIILAAGSGTRMEHHDTPKCFINVNKKFIYQYSLNTFLSVNKIDHIFLMVPELYLKQVKKENSHISKLSVLKGGKTRQESVFNALNELKTIAKDDDIILVHDAARPLVSKEIILLNIAAAQNHGACVTAIKSIDTILKVYNDSVVDIPNRMNMYSEQTPASFKYKILLDAHLNAKLNSVNDSSDDCSLVLKSGGELFIVEGERTNFKITNEIDLKLFYQLLNINY